jgi:hypothetical protein
MTTPIRLRALVELAGKADASRLIARLHDRAAKRAADNSYSVSPNILLDAAAFISAARNAIPDLEAVLARIAELDVVVEAFRDRILRAEAALAALRGQVEAERESCAKVADDVASDANENAVYAQGTEAWTVGAADDLFRDAATATKIATRIRARAALATNRGT